MRSKLLRFLRTKFIFLLAALAIGLLIFLFPAENQGSSVAHLDCNNLPNGVHLLQNIDPNRNSINVRVDPSTDAERATTHWGRYSVWPYGDTFYANLSIATDTDGYVWVQRNDSKNWVAICKNTDAGYEKWAEIVNNNTSVSKWRKVELSRPELPSIEIHRLPLNIDDVIWVQFYGNTWYAYSTMNGNRSIYDNYYQGLHGGLDFGIRYGRNNSQRVYFSTPGKIVNIDNNDVSIRLGDYIIRYVHITPNPMLKVGQEIGHGEYAGDIHDEGGNSHLHFEIRYVDGSNTWIVNPLQLMNSSHAQDIINRFYESKKERHFHYTLDWNHWITPLDQPIIKYRGAMIAPKAYK